MVTLDISVGKRLNASARPIFLTSNHCEFGAPMEADKNPQENYHLLRMPEVVKICGLSRASIYRIIKTNDFLAPVKLSTQAVAWVHHEIMTWVEERMQQRNTKYLPKNSIAKSTRNKHQAMQARL